MYDKFTPFLNILEGFNYNFSPERYELWKDGKCIECSTNLIFKISQDKISNKIFVSTSKNSLNLKENLEFDICYTSGDRVYCATVPKITNINKSSAFIAFKTHVPLGFKIITRFYKNFSESEPYVCSVYFINEVVVKISFSFENDARLLEFYARGIRE